jgi:catechol 2,3-dioxygenase-like lactoylglutathione lyase family enzyme
MNIDHINLRAPAPLLEKLRSFYRSVLDLEEGFRPNFGDRGHWLYSGDQALVHLSESDRDFAKDRNGPIDHVAFQTSGLQNMLAKLESLDIDYQRHFISDINMTQLFIEDPAGTRIEINFPGES